jgi:hypothetical protein
VVRTAAAAAAGARGAAGVTVTVEEFLLALLVLTNGTGAGALLRAHAAALRRLDWACEMIEHLSGALGHDLPRKSPPKT